MAKGKAAVIGGVSGALSFGIGQITTGMSIIEKVAMQAALHGTKGGLMSSIDGGDFGSGFAAGAVSSLVASGIEALGGLGGYYTDDDYTQWSNFASRNPAALKAAMIASGGLSGGLSSSIAGGSFADGFRQGIITSGLNHALHAVGYGPGDPKKAKPKKEDPLKKHAENVKHTLEEWEARYHDKSWAEIATEAGWKQGQPLGPHKDWRYIKAPDGNIMDMRHVSIVGYKYGEILGDTIEHIQYALGQKGSAYDPQDYYSNKIGAYFYQLRHSGSWASNSWAYDFKRFINVHYTTLFNNYKP